MEKRIFVGIPIDLESSSGYTALIKKVKRTADNKELNIKWVRNENLHMTINFLGEVSEDKILSVIEVLQNIPLNHNLDLHVKELGAFPDEYHSRVLWLGIQRKKSLEELHEQLKNEFTKIGITQDQRAFIPHVTIGRLKNPRSLKDIVFDFKSHQLGDVSLKDLVLFESFQQNYMPVYKPIFTRPLCDNAKQ